MSTANRMLMNTTEWKQLLREPLEQSVQAAEKRLTSHVAVQNWLQEASHEAAAGLMGGPGRSEMEAYNDLSNTFENKFEPLMEAVRELTHGCGRVVLDWQPGDPRQTGIRISFGQEFRVHMYQHLAAASENEVRPFLTRLAAHLPRGAPFPKKPHRVGAVLSSSNSCLAVRLIEVVSNDDERVKYVAVFGGSIAEEQKISFEQAAARIADALQREDSDGQP